MPSNYLSSLLFAVFASVSTLAIAAPATKAESVPAPATAQMAVQAVTGKVNLNTADAQSLQKSLSGIGEAKARAIVAHRETHGAFTSIDELIEVKGIGPALLDKNRELLSVN